MFTVFCLSLCISPHRLNSTGLHLLSRVWWDCPHYFWQVLHFFYSFAVPFSLFGSLLTLPVSEFSFCLTKAAIFYLYTSLSYLLPPTQCPLKLCDHLCKSCHPPFSNLPFINIILDQQLLSSMKWILMTAKTQQQ